MIWLLDCLWPKKIIWISWLNFEISFSQFGVCKKKTKIPKKTFGETDDTILSKFLIGFWGGCLNRGSRQNGEFPRGRWRTRVLSFERTCWPFLSDLSPRHQHKTRNHDCFRNFWCCLKLPKDKLEKKSQLNFFVCSFLFCFSYFE